MQIVKLFPLFNDNVGVCFYLTKSKVPQYFVSLGIGLGGGGGEYFSSLSRPTRLHVKKKEDKGSVFNPSLTYYLHKQSWLVSIVEEVIRDGLLN